MGTDMRYLCVIILHTKRGSGCDVTLLKHIVTESCSTERNESFPLTCVGAGIDPERGKTLH